MPPPVALVLAVVGAAALSLALLLIIFASEIAREPARRPTVMPRIRVRGRRLYAGNAPWRAWGLNWGLAEHSPVLDYLDQPTPARFEVLRTELSTARRLGANSVRIPVELGQVMSSPTQTRKSALTALRRVLDLAASQRIYVDIAGNLVWRPERAPTWYDGLPEAARWQVQAAFWRAVAHTAASSPAVLCYELTSEPVASDAPSYYTGQLGRWTFIQNIAQLQGRDGPTVARAWTRDLAAAVRSQDDRPVTIGLLPLLSGSFAPANVADLLDMLVVHEYPEGTHVSEAVALVKAFAAYGKPVLLGETFPLAAAAGTQRSFLLQANPILVGAMEFFDGRDPNRMTVATMSDALYQAALREFIALRPTLLAPR